MNTWVRESWALFGAVIVLASIGCSRTMEPREYCEKNQAAWERAFPDMPQTPEQRELFVGSCTKLLSDPKQREELAMYVRCYRDNIKGKDPKAEYQAMKACQGGEAKPAN